MRGVDSGCQQNRVSILLLLYAVLGKLVRFLVSHFSNLPDHNDLTHSLERPNGVSYMQGTSGARMRLQNPPNV